MTDPMTTVLGRLGYIRADQPTNQTIALRPDPDGPDLTAYPQVVMIQGHSTGESWIRDHAGQLLLAAGVGVFGLAALALVALVAVVAAVAMVSCMAALAIAKAVVASQSGPRRGRGRR